MRVIGLFAALLPAAAFAAASFEARLADAVERNERGRVEALLAAGADVNAAQPDGMTALHWAAYRDDLEAARKLLRAGADVTAENRYGVTPLTPACINGNGAMVELLLAAGADANTSSSGGETVLQLAARTGEIAPVRALLARGAEVNAVAGETGQTALMWAAAEGHAEVVSALLAAGADRGARLDAGFTAFLFAVREGRLAVVRLLLQAGADANAAIRTRKTPRGGRARHRTTALMIATVNAHYEVGAAFAGRGRGSERGGHRLRRAAPDGESAQAGRRRQRSSAGRVGRHERRRIRARSRLHGADPNARMTAKVNLGNTRLNKLGATPFFLAAHAADAELMRALVELGADPLLPNADNSTPLMAAAGLGTRSPGEDAGTEPEVLAAVRLALELGADIDAVDDNGETAMHGAAYKNLPKVVALLAAKGADIEIWNKRNAWGWTPLEIAEGYRFGNFKPLP